MLKRSLFSLINAYFTALPSQSMLPLFLRFPFPEELQPIAGEAPYFRFPIPYAY